ncbi:MAG TPA: DUF1192 domain-containing protein [Aestuariivirgaceae bacterium]|jgi:uncharacterized small protein (DUF1192 family)
MEIDEDKLPKRPDIVIGEDLSKLSVEELKRRIEALEAEIERLKSAMSGKLKSREAANSVFKV